MGLKTQDSQKKHLMKLALECQMRSSSMGLPDIPKLSLDHLNFNYSIKGTQIVFLLEDKTNTLARYPCLMQLATKSMKGCCNLSKPVPAEG